MSCYIGLSCLSINKFKRAERNSVLSAEARRILSILSDSPIDEINTDVNGRPFFPGAHMDFSISHSGSAVAVSLVGDPAGSPRKVGNENIHVRTGCDIQLIRPRKNLRNIAEENFSEAERDYIFLQNEVARFFQIWTLKECYIKLRGLSVFDMPKAPSFVSDRKLFAFNAGSPLSFYLYELAYAGECYMLAIAIEGNPYLEIREIRIFSQPEPWLSEPTVLGRYP